MPVIEVTSPSVVQLSTPAPTVVEVTGSAAAIVEVAGTTGPQGVPGVSGSTSLTSWDPGYKFENVKLPTESFDRYYRTPVGTFTSNGFTYPKRRDATVDTVDVDTAYCGIDGGGGQMCIDAHPILTDWLLAGADVSGIAFSPNGGKNWYGASLGIGNRKTSSVVWHPSLVPLNSVSKTAIGYAAIGDGNAATSGLYAFSITFNYATNTFTMSNATLMDTSAGVDFVFQGGNNPAVGTTSLIQDAYPRTMGQLMAVDDNTTPNLLHVCTFSGAVYSVPLATDGLSASATARKWNLRTHVLYYHGSTSGTFTLTFAGQTTGTIAFNASNANIQTALEALPNIGVGNVNVTGSNRVSIIAINAYGALTADFTGMNTVTTGSATFTATAASATLTTSRNTSWNVGQKLRFTTTGTLPAPLVLNKDYYLASITTTSITVTDNLGGPAITMTSTGTGTHTATPVQQVVSNSTATDGTIVDSTGHTAIPRGFTLKRTGQATGGDNRDVAFLSVVNELNPTQMMRCINARATVPTVQALLMSPYNVEELSSVIRDPVDGSSARYQILCGARSRVFMSKFDITAGNSGGIQETNPGLVGFWSLNANNAVVNGAHSLSVSSQLLLRAWSQWGGQDFPETGTINVGAAQFGYTKVGQTSVNHLVITSVNVGGPAPVAIADGALVTVVRAVEPDVGDVATYLTADLAAGVLTLASVTGFPASGTAYCQGQEFTYTGISGSTLTGVSGVDGIVFGRTGDRVVYGPTSWHAVDGYYRASDNKIVVIVGCFNPVLISGTQYACLYRYEATADTAANISTGTWTRLGTVPNTDYVDTFYGTTEAHWLANPFYQTITSLMGRSGFNASQVVADLVNPGRWYISARTVEYRSDNDGAMWAIIAKGNGATITYNVAPSWKTPGLVVFNSTDWPISHTFDGFLTKAHLDEGLFGGPTDLSQGKACWFSYVDDIAYTAAGPASDPGNDYRNTVLSYNPNTGRYTDLVYSTGNGSGSLNTHRIGAAMGGYTGVDGSGNRFHIVAADVGYGLWRMQETGTWTGYTGTSAASSTVGVGLWGRIGPWSALNGATRGDAAPFGTSTNLGSTPDGQTNRNITPLAQFVVNPFDASQIIVLDRAAGKVWLLGTYGTAAPQLLIAHLVQTSLNSFEGSIQNPRGCIAMDPIVPGRIWFATHEGIWRYDMTVSGNSIVGTTSNGVWLASNGKTGVVNVASGVTGVEYWTTLGAPYSSLEPGSIVTWGSLLVVIVPGIKKDSITTQTPGIYQIRSPFASWAGRVEERSDNVDRAALATCGIAQISQVDGTLYVPVHGKGVQVFRGRVG